MLSDKIPCCSINKHLCGDRYIVEELQISAE